ncbi:hypothetical protein GCM10027421_35930 [Microbacterium shaanxiense]
MADLITPSLFVCKSEDLDTEIISGAATNVAAIGTKVLSGAEDASTAWAGLSAPGVFETPDQDAVYALMDPAVEGATTMDGVTSRIATAIETYAAELELIRPDLVKLEEDAAEFRLEALAGYEVSNWEARGFLGNFTTGPDGNPVPVDDANETTTISWREHGPAVEENQGYFDQYNAIIERISAAAVTCATAIQSELTMVCVAPPTVITAEALANTPEVSTWGSAVEEDRNCTESVGHGFSNFGTGIVTGVQALGGYDAATGEQSWGVAGRSWLGVGDFLLSTVIVTSPPMLAAGFLPGPSGDFVRDRVNVAATGWGSLIGWDHQAALAGENGWHKWEEDAVATGTETVANIGTFFIPVAGWAGGGAKVVLSGTKAGSFVVRVGTHVAEFAVPGGSHIVAGTVRIIDLSANGLRGGWRGLVEGIGTAPMRPSPLPGVANAATDVPVLPPRAPVSESLGLDAPPPRSETPGVDGARPGAVDVAPERPDLGVEGPSQAVDPGDVPPRAGDDPGASGHGVDGDGRTDRGAGPTTQDLQRIERFETLIDAKLPDGSWRYDEHVRGFWRGEIFNIENHHRYPLNELHVTKPGSALGGSGVPDAHQPSYNRVDSVVPGEQIVSRKNTQLAEVRPQTAQSYLNELKNKYDPDLRDVVVADTPTNRRDLAAAGFDPDNIIGRPLAGDQVLEVPPQNSPPPASFLKAAMERGIEVKDVKGTEWMVSADGTSVVEIRVDGTTVLHPSLVESG